MVSSAKFLFFPRNAACLSFFFLLISAVFPPAVAMFFFFSLLHETAHSAFVSVFAPCGLVLPFSAVTTYPHTLLILEIPLPGFQPPPFPCVEVRRSLFSFLRAGVFLYPLDIDLLFSGTTFLQSLLLGCFCLFMPAIFPFFKFSVRYSFLKSEPVSRDGWSARGSPIFVGLRWKSLTSRCFFHRDASLPPSLQSSFLSRNYVSLFIPRRTAAKRPPKGTFLSFVAVQTPSPSP